MNLIVKSPQIALWNGHEMPCAIGKNGVIAASAKREGDGMTPIGAWAMREVFYRADRLAAPETALPVRAIEPGDAWCDIPERPEYNRYVRDLSLTRDERLMRDDHIYDIVVVMGYNDEPPIPGRGSAIFLHLARPGYAPSTGCVHLNERDMRIVLREAERASCVEVPGL